MNITMETTRDELIQEIEALTGDFEALKVELSKADARNNHSNRLRADLTENLRKARAHRDRLLDERDTLHSSITTLQHLLEGKREKIEVLEAALEGGS